MDNVSEGGGCFIKWQNKGIAIDPGFNYINNLFKVGLSVGNIDAIIITHGHNDHYIDLDPILTLLYEFNDFNTSKILGLKNIKEGDYKKALHFFERCREINYEDYICEIGESVCLAELTGKITKKSLFQKIGLLSIWKNMNKGGDALINHEKQIKKVDLFLGRSAAKTVNSFTPLQLRQVRNVYLLNPGVTTSVEGYLFDIHPVSAKHWDFYGKSHCIGLHFNLKDKNNNTVCNLGYTSDTGYYFDRTKINGRIAQKELYQEYIDCNILIAHIGSIKKNEFEWLNDKNYERHLYKKHLGILGLIKLICELQVSSALKLVIISEYGEEMKNYRKKITDILNSKNGFGGDPVFRTGDIGLVSSLEADPKIVVDSYHYKPMSVDLIVPAAVSEDDTTGEIKYKEYKGP